MIKNNLIAITMLLGFALMSGNRAVAQTSQLESDEDIKLLRRGCQIPQEADYRC